LTLPRRRGSRFEADVCTFLREHGFPLAERRVMGGARDRGDVAGIPGWVIECKATRELDLAGALTEAKAEAVHASTDNYAAVLKRRNHPVSSAYVVLPLDRFAELLRRTRPSS
jgi:Holliday junction resolvase